MVALVLVVAVGLVLQLAAGVSVARAASRLEHEGDILRCQVHTSDAECAAAWARREFGHR